MPFWRVQTEGNEGPPGSIRVANLLNMCLPTGLGVGFGSFGGQIRRAIGLSHTPNLRPLHLTMIRCQGRLKVAGRA